ncbi:MAG: GTPase Era [Acidimicrobiales bacterium]
MRSGFVALVGRPNAGKSTLLNKILGQKVSIVSNKPQTTRIRVMGVLHRPDAQLVFVDTPGIHKPVSALGEHLNQTAGGALDDVDASVLVVDGMAPFGKGDRYVADKLPDGFIVVITKVDRASRQQVVDQLTATSGLPASEWFPVSGRTGEGVDALVEHLVGRMPEGPQYFPEDMVTDVPEAFHVAELVREQLMRRFRAELPYSIATRVVEWDWPHIRCEILVERDSQKGMVIGKGGQVLKEVGIAVREQLPEGAFIELAVRVEKDWQRRADMVGRLLDPSQGLFDDDF